jgi:hypothetical protein
MLNILQHYQKYYQPCASKVVASSSTELCQQRSQLNPKYRYYTNCINNNPGQVGTPDPSNSTPQKFTKQQKTNELAIGVL